jgi:hypothetical protein
MIPLFLGPVCVFRGKWHLTVDTGRHQGKLRLFSKLGHFFSQNLPVNRQNQRHPQGRVIDRLKPKK